MLDNRAALSSVVMCTCLCTVVPSCNMVTQRFVKTVTSYGEVHALNVLGRVH
jgi:hypothetical protein